ncbi:putative protein kinase RLK-Pelle-LRR-IX family [Helianthus annuus]|nr:putative protein kinase RLK-Pelle-LRR-IX family [Helianthus annuus]
MYIYYGRGKRAGWKRLTFGMGQVKNFESRFYCELMNGGFGIVYKGQLDVGTKIAVKRMESVVICIKALDEFELEISVLTKVRHRHLVLLLGYSTQGLKIILVYEYMPQGELSRHLFHLEKFKLEPLSWKRRLSIALDVARGMEYLHSLAHRALYTGILNRLIFYLAMIFEPKFWTLDR